MHRLLTPYDGMETRPLLDEKAAMRADHSFLIWKPLEAQPACWSYAKFVASFGALPGQRVLKHLDNCPEELAAGLGCAYETGDHVPFGGQLWVQSSNCPFHMRVDYLQQPV